LWQDDRVEFLLFGLEPPSNIARLARQAQESLYAAWGLVSPLALPPLVPLRFAAPAQPPSTEELRRLEQELVQELRGPAAPCAPRCRFTGCALHQGALFWELEAETGPLASRVQRLCPWPAPEPPPFPPHPGFLLALPEPGTDLSEAAAGLGLPAPGSFTTLALELLGVRRLTPEPLVPLDPPPPPRPWYRALEWEVLLRLPLRKGKQDSG
jgi:hypothetical protein